jgi:hypothetical protein
MALSPVFWWQDLCKELPLWQSSGGNSAAEEETHNSSTAAERD